MPHEASQVGHRRGGSVSVLRDQVKRRPPGTIATFVLCGGSGTRVLSNLPRLGGGSERWGWRTGHPGSSAAHPDPDTWVPLQEQSRCCPVPRKDPRPDEGLLQVLTPQHALETRVLCPVDMRASISPA